ncbi:expressed unknown protein [Seminavis robusta]|uniref:MYND-type domain-containing protein n=1 Tax=Seminavis robusta TaxID=568900 RepID=A0A9N8HAX1_9STRA|nr:expressed unknown protein [Seminavis robusta]|eukprot:Sro313_g114820.1 n/a (634) ;mRNA; r:39131-41202
MWCSFKRGLIQPTGAGLVPVPAPQASPSPKAPHRQDMDKFNLDNLNEEQKSFLRSAFLEDPDVLEDLLKSGTTTVSQSTKSKLTKKCCYLLLDKESRSLLAQLKATISTVESSKIIRRLLEKTGTSCDVNDSDPYGNGDQTPLPSEGASAQILRYLFADGGDLEQWWIGYRMPSSAYSGKRLPAFAWNCIMGDHIAVRNELQAQPTFQDRRNVLEQRVTSMRMSPLILTIASSKNLDRVSQYTGRPTKLMNHVAVVGILLMYGASPNAKEVTGKTACHYGAGSHATKDTLEMTDMCIRATATTTFLGRNVVLDGLSRKNYNGMEGILGGFVSETERRVFHPLNDPKKEMAIRPDNIFVVSKCAGQQSRQVCILDKSLRAKNLVEVQDRIGSISLHEVAMSSQGDVAKFLLHRSSNCLDIPDLSGRSVRDMFMKPVSGVNPVNDVIRGHLKKTSKKKLWKVRKKEACEMCGTKANRLGRELRQCTSCLDAVYCSKECQVSHWKGFHRKECKEREKQLGLELGDPASIPKGHTSINFCSQTRSSQFHCTAPKSAKQDEKFWVKVQSEGLQHNLLIYDKTHYCNFYLAPGSLGFRDLAESVADQTEFLGKKSFYLAKINQDGKFVIFPHTSAVKKW